MLYSYFRTILLFIFFFVCITLKGQNTAERYVFNSSGQWSTVGGFEFISSMGEPVVNESQYASVGFLQVIDSSLITSVPLADFSNDEFLIYPSPVVSQLNIFAPASVQKIEIKNYLGQVVASFLFTGNEIFSLTDLAHGMYFVSFYVKDLSIVKTIKILKIDAR